MCHRSVVVPMHGAREIFRSVTHENHIVVLRQVRSGYDQALDWWLFVNNHTINQRCVVVSDVNRITNCGPSNG